MVVEGIGLSKPRQNNETYAGMIQSVDESLGKLIQRLKR